MNILISFLAGILGGILSMFIPIETPVQLLSNQDEIAATQANSSIAQNEFFISSETHGKTGIIDPFTIDLPPGLYRYETNGIGPCCVIKEPEVAHCTSLALTMYFPEEGRIRWDDEDPACTFYLEVSEFDDDGWSIHIWPEP